MIGPMMFVRLLQKQSRDQFAQINRDLAGIPDLFVGSDCPNIPLTSIDLSTTTSLHFLLDGGHVGKSGKGLNGENDEGQGEGKKKELVVLNFGSYT